MDKYAAINVQLVLILTTSDFLNEITSHYYILTLQVLFYEMNLINFTIRNWKKLLLANDGAEGCVANSNAFWKMCFCVSFARTFQDTTTGPSILPFKKKISKISCGLVARRRRRLSMGKKGKFIPISSTCSFNI